MLLTSAVRAADPSLVGWWRLDDGGGTSAIDSSGNGNDGALMGDPQWGVGRIGGALQFNGIDDYVEVPHAEILTVDTEVTVMAWVNAFQYEPAGAGYQGIIAKGNGPRSYSLYTTAAGVMHFSTGPSGGYIGSTSTATVPLNEWTHVCAQVINGGHQYYMNGEDAGSGGAGATLQGTQDTGTVLIGRTQEGANRSFGGLIDDARVYNRGLSQEEIQSAMIGQGLPLAFGPNPEDGAPLEATWVTLSWKPGDFAVSHDVYMGEIFDDVNDGTGDTFKGNQASTMFIAGFAGFPFPDGLVAGTTYYWRIDEVNDANVASPWKGEVWSFWVPPMTAYNPDPADGAGFVDPSATFTWTGGFGAKLHTVYIGTNFDDVDNAAGGTPLGSASFSPGTLESEKVYYWRVDEFDPPNTYKGDVWAFTTPGAVGNPQPANGAVDVPMAATLSWTSADNATSHELYFGTDADAVKNATTASPEYIGPRALGAESYDPGGLAWDSSYAWRVDEVYATETIKGLVWSFATAAFISVDDFESYNDIDPPDANSNRIFDIWIDGFGTTDNGALVGNDLPPYAEQTIVHGGAQSMPYFYDNANKTSEATLTLVYPRDWTEEGVTKLSLWFRGTSSNAADRLFVALGNAVVYHDDSAATQIAGWNKWVIDLTEFADVDLTNVNTVTIGIGTKGSPAAGGTGTMYFDDIRLVR